MRQPTGDRLRTLRMRERCNKSEPRSPAATERQNDSNGRSRRGGRDVERSDRKEAQGESAQGGAR